MLVCWEAMRVVWRRHGCIENIEFETHCQNDGAWAKDEDRQIVALFCAVILRDTLKTGVASVTSVSG